MHALSKAIHAADDLGIYAVEVIAKNDAARAFYERYGFKPLLDDALHMYLPLAAARKAFAK